MNISEHMCGPGILRACAVNFMGSGVIEWGDAVVPVFLGLQKSVSVALVTATKKIK